MFTLSTHILPAAFPSGPDVPYPEGCDADGLGPTRSRGRTGCGGRRAKMETGIKLRNAFVMELSKHWLGELPGYEADSHFGLRE